MELSGGLIQLLSAIQDEEKRSAMVRRIVLNEAYFNLGIIKVLGTKCVSQHHADRNKLILQLRTDSRAAHDLFSIERGTVSSLKDRLLGWLDGTGPRHEADFADWKDSEIYHYCLNKIDILKVIVAAQLESEDKLILSARIASIRGGLLALVGKLHP